MDKVASRIRLQKQKHIAHADNRKFHGAYGIYGGFPSA